MPPHWLVAKIIVYASTGREERPKSIVIHSITFRLIVGTKQASEWAALFF